MTASWTRVVLHGFLLCLLAAAAATAADRTGTAAAAPLRTARSAEWLGGPVVGFLASESPVEIRAVLGVPGAAVAGEPLALPEEVARVRLAPGHRYAILDFAGAAPPSILNLEAGGEPAGVAEAMSWIDQVEFSPTGRSAALYSAAERRLQIWTGLPREPHLAREIAAPEAVRFAVSDDGRWLLAASPSGAVDLISAEDGTQPVFRASGLPVLAFLPNRLEAVVCDGERGEIHLLGGLDGTVSTRLLAADLAGVDVVAPSSDGRSVVALAFEPGRAWRIDVESGAARPFDLPVRPELLEAMRVPDSYLISSRAGEPAWLLIPGEAGIRAYFVPAVAKLDSGASQ